MIFPGLLLLYLCPRVLMLQRLALMLRNLGFPAIPIHGQLTQAHRLGALNKFKSGDRNILIATDVASRGLDIPAVDVVINFDVEPFKGLHPPCR